MARTRREQFVVRLVLSLAANIAIAGAFFLAFSALASHAEFTENIEYKLVETANGVVRGKTAETLFEGRKYFAFKGIPYAKAPVGDLRFRVKQLLNGLFIKSTRKCILKM